MQYVQIKIPLNYGLEALLRIGGLTIAVKLG